MTKKRKSRKSVPFNQKRKSIFTMLAFALATAVVGTYLLLASRAEASQVTTGLWALNYGQIDAESNPGRYQYVILQEYMAAEWVPKVRAKNPDTKILIYKDVAGMRGDCVNGAEPKQESTGVTVCYAAQNHPEWFLTDSSGKRLTFCDYSAIYAADIGNAAYQQQWLQNVTTVVKSTGADGVMLDDVNMYPGHCLEGKIAKYTTNDAYKQATESFMANVGPKLKNVGLVVPNVALDLYKEDHYTTAAKWVNNGYVTGWVREHWTKWLGSTSDDRFTTDLLNRQARLQSIVESAGKAFLGLGYGSSTSETELMRYERATWLLGWSGNPNSAFMYRPDGRVDAYSPEWTIDVGAPINSRYSTPEGAWRRDFGGGTVVVNPTPNTTISVSLGGEYTLPNGSLVSSVTLSPKTGLILRKQNQTPTVALIAPTDSATVSGTVKSRADASSNVTKVEFYIDNQVYATDTAAPFEYVWDTTRTANGNHTVAVKAYAGSTTATSNIVSVVVSNSNQAVAPDTSPPVVGITHPVSGAKVASRRDTISASATDNVGVSKMEIYIDNKLVLTYYGSSVSYNWNTRKLSSGTHTIIVKTYDAAGNVGSTSVTVSK